MDLVIEATGQAVWRGRRYPCTIGRSGIRADKTEGDGVTPVGRFEFLRVLYRADRRRAPRTILPVSAIRRDDGWCDATGDPRYNQQVSLPYDGSCESLWREDHIYDLIVVTSHNSDPIVDGAGSAIFVHLMRENAGPTEGCIAFQPKDLIEILEEWQEGDRIVIAAP